MSSKKTSFYQIFGSSLVVLFVLVGSHKSHSQFYTGMQMEFGKNRVQYRDLIWSYYRYGKFDTYFYQNGNELAIYTSLYAKKYLSQLESEMQTSLDRKVQFIIFNNLSDLKASNIGQEYDAEYNTGGTTHIIGRKIILYFNGDHQDFEAQIKAGIIEVLMNQMISGVSIGAQMRSSMVVNYPDWFKKGLISFYSQKWSVEFDNKMRDAVLSGVLTNLNVLDKERSMLGGHSFWRYIALQYGADAIPNIVQMSRVSRSIDRGFYYVLGKSYKELSAEWLSFYQKYYSEQEENYDNPELSLAALKTSSRYIYQRPKISPDGERMIFVTNEFGKKKVWLYDFRTGKKKKLFRKGYVLDDKNDLSYPLLAWHPSGKFLSILVEEEGYVYFYTYEIENKSFVRRLLSGFDKILDFDYSDDGTKIVMSAVLKGQSDIVVYDLSSGFIEAITQDIADDFHPRFINNSTQIVFSSNRADATLLPDPRRSQKLLKNKMHDIFVYDYARKAKKLVRITDTPDVSETKPADFSDDYITYLSDANGIFNRYVARFDSVIARVDTVTHYRYYSENFPMSNYNRSILDYDVRNDGSEYLELFLKDGKFHVLRKNAAISIIENVNDIVKTNYQNEKLAAKASDSLISIQEKEKPIIHVKRFRMVRRGETDDDQRKKVYANHLSGDSTGQAARATSEYRGAHKKRAEIYQLEFGINKLINQVDFGNMNQSYQRYTGGRGPIYLNSSLASFFQVSASDLMEDYRVTAGVHLNFDLKNNEYLLSFKNYKHRLDQEFVFHRSPQSGEYNIYTYNVHEFYYNVSYPFDRVLSLRASGFYRNEYVFYKGYNEDFNDAPESYFHSVGLKTSFVYDAVRNLGMNLYQGQRFKVFAEYNQLVNDWDQQLIVAGVDYRHYTRLFRTMIWANRFAMGTSLGKSHLIYYLGGVDSWIGTDIFDNTINVDRDMNYAYQTLATNMRGFKQNTRNGNSFAVINSELRIPIFNLLFNRPLRSSFFNNFQIIAFGDLGTAFTGVNPFSLDNRTYEQVIREKPLVITVETLKSPLVGSVGAGLRTTILGYFIRFDLGWGIENNRVKKPVYHLSFSLDF